MLIDGQVSAYAIYHCLPHIHHHVLWNEYHSIYHKSAESGVKDKPLHLDICLYRVKARLYLKDLLCS